MIYIGLGVIFLGMAVITPQVLALRIRVLNFLHLSGLADWHERNFARLVVIARWVLVAMAAAALILGIFFR